jgi:hypothetical protein
LRPFHAGHVLQPPLDRVGDIGTVDDARHLEEVVRFTPIDSELEEPLAVLVRFSNATPPSSNAAPPSSHAASAGLARVNSLLAQDDSGPAERR